MKLSRYWIILLILSTVINLLSIKGFPLALGTLYLPILFKVVKLQLNLSDGLVDADSVNANTFIRTNQKGIIISVICCIAITVALYIYLDDFYNTLTGVLGGLIALSPVTLVIGFILYILTSISVVQAVKERFQ